MSGADVVSTGTPHARASTIPVDEFDTSGLKGTSDYFESCSTGVTYSRLKMTDSHNANSGAICEVLLCPIEKSAGCPALCRGDHRGER